MALPAQISRKPSSIFLRSLLLSFCALDPHLISVLAMRLQAKECS